MKLVFLWFVAAVLCEISVCITSGAQNTLFFIMASIAFFMTGWYIPDWMQERENKKNKEQKNE